MAHRRISMIKVREIIRLKEEAQLSLRKISRVLNISRPAITEYLMRYKYLGITYQEVKKISDTELLKLFTGKQQVNKRQKKIIDKFEYYTKELKRTGVTLQLLWKEYRLTQPEGYSYAQFCNIYRQWRKALKVTMHMDHKAGDKIFVDFTGKKLFIVDQITGAKKEVEIFVATLGASQVSYVEACMSQKKGDWIKVNQNALLYFGGVTTALVPDCLKAGVSNGNKYEPDINPEYADFARHYGTTILPARPYCAKDKALVENAVKIIYTRIFAPLRNQVFYSLEELNKSIRNLLEIHNNKKFQKMDISRWQLFNEIEKNVLKPLPVNRYEFKKFLSLKVQLNYHIELREDVHYYSIPYKYIGKQITVIYTDSVVEIYHDNIRIITYKRERTRNGYTTLPEHMPPQHRFYSEWSPQKMINWGAKIGENVKVMIEELFKSRKHPEQAFKVCLGLLSLSKKYSDFRINNACKRAVQFNFYSYKAVKNILEKGLDKLVEEDLFTQVLPDHNNIRGSEYFN